MRTIKIAGVPEHFNFLAFSHRKKEFKPMISTYNGLMFLKEQENVSNAAGR
jgi:hypothetical protein